MKPLPNKSLDASGGSVFLNLLGAAEGALMLAAASTQPFGGHPIRSHYDSVESSICTSSISGPNC